VSIRIGIGSWSDDAYRGVLYPPGLPASERLRHYATIFDHVEVNSTYYGAPKPEAVKKWIAETPRGFLFDIKLHRVFSQSPASAAKTEGKRDLLGYTLERLEPLMAAKKLGVFLLLLTARFSAEKHSLAELDVLAERLRPFPLAVELRDPAWVKGAARAATLAAFRERGIAWVAVDMPKGKEFLPAIDEATRPDLAYLRLHGRNRAGYLAADRRPSSIIIVIGRQNCATSRNESARWPRRPKTCAWWRTITRRISRRKPHWRCERSSRIKRNPRLRR